MTILIACMGLFGWLLMRRAANQGNRHSKSIGCFCFRYCCYAVERFYQIGIDASVVAIPVAWWMMSSWLSDFAYRTKIYWWVFVIAGTLALFVALFTVGLKALKAAIINPVKSLRTE
jgi:putative ABC transport system permease protein